MGSIRRSCRFAFLATIAACGQVKGTQSTDAQSTEGSVDADATGKLTVVTQNHVIGSGPVGAPAMMIQLIGLRPDGSISDMVQSDSAGHASMNVYPDGSVTAIYPHKIDAGADLVTYFGVQPGDSLLMGQPFGLATSTSIGTMTASWPSLPGTAFVDVFTPCGGFGASVPSQSLNVSASDSCNHTPFDMVFLAFNSADVIIGFNFLSPTFQAGSAVSINSWRNPINTALSITGLPDEVTSLSFDLFDITDDGKQLFATGDSGSPTGGAFTGTVPWGPGINNTMGELFLSRQGPFSETQLLDSLTNNPTSWTVASAALPPWLGGELISGPARTLEWFPIKTAGASTLDGVVATLNWSHQTTVGGTQTNIPFSWNMVIPPDVTRLDMPALPAPFDADLPAPEDFIGGRIRLFAIQTATGYAAFRALPESTLVCPECAVRAGAVARIIVNN